MKQELQSAHNKQAEQFVAACNRIHASLEIPAIMRATVISALELVEAEIGTTGLLLEDEMAFSECFKANSWKPLKLRLATAEGVIGQLTRHGHTFLSNNPAAESGLNRKMDSQLGGVRQLIAVPIHAKGDGLIGCLLLFNKKSGDFTQAEQITLEQLASTTSIAVDHAIRISESQRVEEDLQKSVATYRTLVEQIPAITYIASLDRSSTLFVSPQIKTILGYSQDEFLATPDMWQAQIHPDDRERVLSEVQHSFKTGEPFHSEYRIVKENGQLVWFKDDAAVVQDKHQPIYLQGVMSDITGQKEFEAKLIQMAHFDPLTGLANRALFHDRLNQSIAQAKRQKEKLAVLYLDLDGFKLINDTLGHQVGDRVLAETAQRLKQSVREMDTVARMGGDEFTIILNNVSSHADISKIADKLLTAVAAPYPDIKTAHRIHISIGIAVYPDDSGNSDALITAADNAMYHAKNHGKNRYHFSTNTKREHAPHSLKYS